MTYTHHTSSYSAPEEHEFTAFSEEDVGASGSNSVSCGYTFTMPGSASLCFTVIDNDESLSGDGRCRSNDEAKDSSYQTASITEGPDGAEVGNGGQIYAEKYYWVSDAEGNKYVMIEIEQEGSGENYYTFLSSNGVPPEGAELTVESASNVRGDWLEYSNMSAGDCEPATPVDADCYVIEAEDMQLWGYKVEANEDASGGKIIAASYCKPESYAKTFFRGTEGNYDLKLCVIDENDGQGEINIYINGELIKSVVLDHDTGGVYGETGVFREIVLDDIQLKTNDVIVIEGIRDGCEYARVDKLEICKDNKVLPAALGDRVWLDENKDGIQNNGEFGVEGVTVLLKDADTGDVLDTTTTDENGNYLFTNLQPGDYSVGFVAPDGYEFTEQDAGSNDGADSDANTTTGMTGPYTLEAGETNLTVDAGLVEKNKAPIALDDAGEGCADEIISVDVLANDSDAEDGVPVVSAINGVAISQGATVAVNGVNVTLTGGTLSFDGEAAYAFLDIGEMATEDFIYTVTDSEGASATATVSVTFCGDANSITSFCDSLPDQIQYQVSSTSAELPYEDEAFDIKLTSSDSRFDGVVFEDAYCLSLYDPADGGETFDTAPLLTADVFCFEEAPADVFNANQVSFANGKTAGENLDVINWILNQDFKDQGYSDWEVQRTIWELTDDIDTDYLDAIDPAFGDAAEVDELIALAIDFDENKTEEYAPGLGDKMGLILDPNPATSTNSQPFIIAVEIEDYDCIC